MELFARRARKSHKGAGGVLQRKQAASPPSTVLEYFSKITIDKIGTIEALNEAERIFLQAAKSLRERNNIELAEIYETRAGLIAVLLMQLGDNKRA